MTLEDKLANHILRAKRSLRDMLAHAVIMAFAVAAPLWMQAALPTWAFWSFGANFGLSLLIVINLWADWRWARLMAKLTQQAIDERRAIALRLAGEEVE